MKDYSLNSQEQANFVENYDVKRGEIVSNLANGKKHFAPYSPENEDKILDIMDAQTVNLDKKEKAFKKIKRFFSVRAILLGIVTVAGMVGYFTSGISSLIPLVIPFLTGTGTLIYSLKTRKTIKTLKDIEKTRYFKDHEDELNAKIKEHCNMTLNLPKKKVRIINRTPEDENVFDINKIDVDGWTLEELRTVKANIEREEYFGFDYNYDEEDKDLDCIKLELTPKNKREN